MLAKQSNRKTRQNSLEASSAQGKLGIFPLLVTMYFRRFPWRFTFPTEPVSHFPDILHMWNGVSLR